MAFNVENGSAGPLDIEDLGITLALGEISDLALRGDPAIIAISAQAGDEISNLITTGDLIIKDPIDGTTDLSVADGLAVARSYNDPNWRVGAGARIGDVSDVALTAPATDEILRFNGTDWVNSAGVGGFSGYGIWRYRTAITSNPASGQLQFDNVTINLATELFVNAINDGGTDMTTFLSLLTSGELIYLQIQSDASQFVVIEIGTSSLASGVFTFPITNIESQGIAPTNNAPVAFIASHGASGVPTDELVKVSANDTTAGFLNGKLVAGPKITLVENNDGGNETLTIDAITTGSGPGTISGASIGYHFLSDNKGGAMYDSWLGTTTKHITSDVSPYVMPFNGIIAALTYSNKTASSDGDFEIYIAGDGSGATDTLRFRWEIRNGRVGRISSLYTAETFTIDWTGITGALLPTGATPGAWFDVTTPDFASITYRFWFDDLSTTPPAAGGVTLTAIIFTGAETDQAISDLVVAAMIGADAEFAGAANGGTPLITTTMATPGVATDAVDGAVPTNAVFAVTTQGVNGPMNIPITKGDKMGVLVGPDPGGGVEPQDVVMSVYVQWSDEPQEEGIEDYVGNF